jgi:hypothetical protein
MIVIDENLHDRRIMAAISAWYPGRVVSIITLRPKSVIKDEAIPVLLREVPQPTFVTINIDDFWRKVEPHKSYCLINVDLPKERVGEISDLLRHLFRLPNFKTKASRMGKIVHLTPNHIEYYESDWQVQPVPWPKKSTK